MKNGKRVSFVLVWCAVSLWITGCQNAPGGASGGTGTPGATPSVRYRSTGTIGIDLGVSGYSQDDVVSLLRSRMTPIVQDLQSERVIRGAMATPEWKGHRNGPAAAYIADWNKNLIVKFDPDSSNITVTYTDDSKDAAEVAPIAVRSLISAYMSICCEERKVELLEMKSRQQLKSDILDQKIADSEAQIAQLLHADGEDLQMVFASKFAAHVELEKELRHDQADLLQNKDEIQKTVERDGVMPILPTDYVRVDPVMAEMYHARSAAEVEYQDFVKRLGPDHPQSKAAKEHLKTRDEDMQRHTAELHKKFFIKPKIDGTGSLLVSKDLGVEEAAVARERELYDKQKLELDDLSARAHKVNILRAEKSRLEEDRRKVRTKIEDIAQEIEMASDVRVIDAGGQAVVVPGGGSAGSK